MLSDAITWITHPRRALVVVAGICLFALSGALIAEFVLGQPPCELCTWQRIPYAVIVVLALVGLLPWTPRKLAITIIGLAALGFLTEMGIAIFHMGVENHWWEGTAECSSKLPADLSLDDLKAAIMNAPAARCDEVGWTILDVSITIWNTAFSLAATGFAGLATLANVKRRPN